MIGNSLSHYRILEKIGEGGMGVVYRALDSRLDRTVAIKVLRPEAVGDAERKWRFVREAKAASALNHPHIVTIHDIDSDQGVDFLVMEYVEGTPLDRLIPKGGLPVREALDYGEQIASALGAAHAAGIVHRDVKPANVMIAPGGRVKVLDFGLAKLVERNAADGALTSDSTATAGTALERTRQGAILGTIAYMSPEQAEGKPVDARSDVFSLGSVLYEMLSGCRPFEGDSHLRTMMAILRDPPALLGRIRPDVSAKLERVVQRALEKRPEHRFPSANEMGRELADLRAGVARPRTVAAGVRGKTFVRTAAVTLLLAAGAGAWLFARHARVRRAREVALPEISRLVEQEKPTAALRLSREAERYLPEEVERLRRDSWPLLSLKTVPPGADVSVKDYLDWKGDWQPLGRTPIEGLRIPQAYYRWKVVKAGFQPLELAAASFPSPPRLDPDPAVPPGMVRVPGGPFVLNSLPAVELRDFWIDKYEVTNRQFKSFLDAGGYGRREYWKQPFVSEGRELSWEEALAKFRDATGRPGPAGWELGSFPEGREDYPVDGVSWYEAAAYAEFAGKSLPTVYHWYRAAGADNFSEVLRLANFGGNGTVRIGSSHALSPFGSYDMAGNVKEWCWNQSDGRRYILGGSWSDVNYMFRDPDAQDPLRRPPGYGFRCIRDPGSRSEVLGRPIAALSRDYNKETPVSDEVFRLYKSFYSYDRTPVDGKTEGAEVEAPYWRMQKVNYGSSYGNERIPAFFFAPKNAAPPYQTVLYFPSNQARLTRSSSDLNMRNLDFVLRSGRAVLFPVYKDTFERHVDRTESGPSFRRDLIIQWSKEVGRSIDYLETRRDVDRSRLAYYGVSLGAIDGVTFVALEDRFKVAILSGGSFRLDQRPPEIEPINFAPRLRIPVLLITGRYDFSSPYETAQVPAFRFLGTPEKDKRHFVHDGGHIPTRMQPIIKEILDWLDRYLGPVSPAK
jgi:formylglycine-generating enzyme required for sulfatase activity/tRNA A-37 threonylcarbamoyl transferase component Bud32/pimeloyl-ACP methyl ester carboxylesterase